MDERRHSTRLEEPSYIFVTRMPEEHFGSEGGGTNFHKTLDVSRNGLRIQAKRHLPPDSLVKVLVPRHDVPEGLTLLGVVRWVDQHPTQEAKFNVGIEFFDLENPDGQFWVTDYEARMSRTNGDEEDRYPTLRMQEGSVS